MRVPILMVIPLCLLVVCGAWWQGTRKLDFMTPPPAEKLEQAKRKVLESFPAPKEPPAAPAPPPASPETQEPPIHAKPEIDLGQLALPAALNEYMDRSELGASHFIELAGQLEEKGEFQRALLAWERALDVGKPDAAQAGTAISAIKRLRPTLPDWNSDAGKTQTITLHAGTGRSTAKVLGPILQATAAELSAATSGLLKVTTKLTPGKDPKNTKALTPIAIWLTGEEKDSRATEVMSFTPTTKELLPDDLRKAVFHVLRGYLTRGGTQAPPPALAENSPPLDGFNAYITRQQWLMLGTILNLPVPKPPETPPVEPAKPEKPKKPSKKP